MTEPLAPSAAMPYGTPPPASPLPQRRPVSLPRLQQMREAGEKITMLTVYDATFAAVADAAGVECLLVGGSLGMVCQGLLSTVGVTLETMVYHTQSVARGLYRAHGTAWLIADMPYGSYAEGREQALRNACALMRAGAHMVKLEGGSWTAPTVQFLVERGIPVCAHLGLTPQTVHALGGYHVQGKTDQAAQALRRHARELQDAGAAMLVLEMVPALLAAEQTTELTQCATIGIGAGKGTAGQVLVLHDMLGMNLRQDGALRAQLHAGRRQRARRHGGLRDRGQKPNLPRRRTSCLVGEATLFCRTASSPCTSCKAFPICAPCSARSDAPPSCQPWATCTTAIAR